MVKVGELEGKLVLRVFKIIFILKCMVTFDVGKWNGDAFLDHKAK